MDLTLLCYFTTLSQCMNFSVAADELYLSQSSLSKRIKSLETKLGVDLFLRHPRSIELTEAGKAILPFAANIANEYDKMREAISLFANDCGMFRISASSFLSYYGMMNGISAFIQAHPEINVNIREINSQTGLELLDTDQVDACMMFSKMISTDKYNKYPLVHDCMVAMMNENHPFAIRERITLEQLGSQELVLISERDEPFFKEFILEEFERNNIKANIQAYGVWISAIQHIIKQSCSISILPKRVAQRLDSTGILYKEIEGVPDFYFSLITKCDHTKKVLFDFIPYVKENKEQQAKPKSLWKQ